MMFGIGELGWEWRTRHLAYNEPAPSIGPLTSEQKRAQILGAWRSYKRRKEQERISEEMSCLNANGQYQEKWDCVQWIRFNGGDKC